MRILLLLFLCTTIVFNAQSQEQEKDTVQTEVVEIITAFNPNIADAQKIKNNPKLEFSKKTEKKEMEYKIFSAPVASTFIPKSGVIKGIDVGVREKLYKNYVAAGYGNYNSPYLEAFFHSSNRFRNEFGVNVKYLASNNNIKDTELNSTFSNLYLDAFYKKEDRYFDWKVGLHTERNNYNWYGLPALDFSEPTINAIEEAQQYNLVKASGEFTFNDSYIDYAKLYLSNFSDNFDSNEIRINLNTKLDFPIYKIIRSYRNDDEISIKTNFEYLNGKFKRSYSDTTNVNYLIATVSLEPSYSYKHKYVDVDSSLKVLYSIDSENDANNFLLLPNITAKSAIYKQYASIYGGFSSDLHTNTFQSFAEENPFVSPTLFMTQTLEKSNFFIGFNGNITNAITYNLKASSKSEEDKPLFLRNNSKSDGFTTTQNNNEFLGYEYGNSFGVFYDDIKTTTLFAELAYEFSKFLSFNAQAKYSTFALTNAASPWNLPSTEVAFTAKYKHYKWFATANIFYIDERTDVLYNAEFPSSFGGIQNLDAFVDVNLNGGYHFTSKLSAFLKINNLLNTQYQQFANFDVQGFQVLGGITYKFDI
ncbi:TonB-dependent receptor [Polaribacter sp.]|nr:TonB-dependent receptor [Polaribacter sp.]